MTTQRLLFGDVGELRRIKKSRRSRKQKPKVQSRKQSTFWESDTSLDDLADLPGMQLTEDDERRLEEYFRPIINRETWKIKQSWDTKTEARRRGFESEGATWVDSNGYLHDHMRANETSASEEESFDWD